MGRRASRLERRPESMGVGNYDKGGTATEKGGTGLSGDQAQTRRTQLLFVVISAESLGARTGLHERLFPRIICPGARSFIATEGHSAFFSCSFRFFRS